MKKIIGLLLVISLLFLLAACGGSSAQGDSVEPQVAQMRAICELATMECYYHNVAKYNVENAEHFLWFSKDKDFWVEYSGQVTIGIDATLVTLEVSGDQVTITIPPAEVLGSQVDPTSLTEDSFIVAKDSADITAEDQTAAFSEAQKNMLSTASSNETLLVNAQQRAQTLLEDYVRNIGNSTGIAYQITWVYVDENGEPID